MKKTLALILAGILVFSMAACSKPKDPVDPAGDPVAEGFELALVISSGSIIDDKSFIQEIWTALTQYATDKNITSKYYKAIEQTTTSLIETIGLAVAGGAKVVVTPSYLFEPAIFVCQEEYPDVKFILVDGIPNNGASDDTRIEKVADNTYSVFYNEEQSGFLAGYAAVKDGYRKLGFMGGMALPSVINLGYGFVQGAEYAGAELGLAYGDLDIKYHYTGGFVATPEAQAQAASWYEGGTELIFTCGGEVGTSVMTAAEANDTKVIGVDVDQSAESATVISSAIKNLKLSLYNAIDTCYTGTFPGGQSVHLNVAQNAVGLSMETSKWNTFTQADYDAIYAKLIDGAVKVLKNTDFANVNEIKTIVVKVTEITQ